MSALQLDSGETLSTRLHVHSLADTLRDTHLDAGRSHRLLLAARDALAKLGASSAYFMRLTCVPVLLHTRSVLYEHVQNYARVNEYHSNKL